MLALRGLKPISWAICLLLLVSTNAFSKSKKEPKPKKQPRIENPLRGMWESDCFYLGGNEYSRELIEFKGQKKIKRDQSLKGTVWRRHIQSGNADCSDPWLQTSNKFSYQIPDTTQLAEGTEIDLKLKTTRILSYSDEVTNTLKEICVRPRGKRIKKKFETGVERRFMNKTCSETVQYPKRNKQKYFDIIRLVDNQMTLGANPLAQTEADRPSVWAEHHLIPSVETSIDETQIDEANDNSDDED